MTRWMIAPLAILLLSLANGGSAAVEIRAGQELIVESAVAVSHGGITCS